jgi:hypothetical protein
MVLDCAFFKAAGVVVVAVPPLRLDDFDWVFIHPPALAGVLDHRARAEDLESLVELVLGVVSFAIVVDVD